MEKLSDQLAFGNLKVKVYKNGYVCGSCFPSAVFKPNNYEIISSGVENSNFVWLV